MEVIILEDKEQVSQLVAKRFIQLVNDKPNAVLGLATGGSPLTIYKNIVEKHKQSLVSFENVKVFNLDEYVGLGSSQKGSYAYYMDQNLFSQIDIQKMNCFIPNGLATDISLECENYEKLIRKEGPIDLQLLGIGRDGHIGFNEPMSSLQSRTRLKTLTQETRDDNAKYFSHKEEIPIHVITMGIATIMDACEIVLVAFGEAKAQAVAQAIEGPLTAMVPASILQWHPKVKVVVDQAAAAKLKNREYYQWVYSRKPDWQKIEFSEK